MSEWFADEEYGDDRRALLSYYSSKCNSHITYILTLVVAFFAFVQAQPFIRIAPQIDIVIISATMGTFASLSWYLFFRTVYWGTLSAYITYVRPLTIKECEKRTHYEVNCERVYITKQYRLNLACMDIFENFHHLLTLLMRIDVSLLSGVLTSAVIYLIQLVFLL